MNPIIGLLPDPDMATWPVLRKLTDYDKVEKIFGQVFDYLKPYIADHKAEFNPDNPPRDLIDVWLGEMHVKASEPTSGFSPDLGTESLLAAMQELCFAGMDTTSQSVTWLMLYLLHHPDVKKRVQAEIDEVTTMTLSITYLEVLLVSAWLSATLLPISCKSVQPVPARVEDPVSLVWQSSSSGATINPTFHKML